MLNIFTGSIGFVAAVTAFILGATHDELASITLAAYILLFAFTYLWVAINQYLNPDGRGLGWYCLFVSITAVPTARIAANTRPAGTAVELVNLLADTLYTNQHGQRCFRPDTSASMDVEAF